MLQANSISTLVRYSGPYFAAAVKHSPLTTPSVLSAIMGGRVQQHLRRTMVLTHELRLLGRRDYRLVFRPGRRARRRKPSYFQGVYGPYPELFTKSETSSWLHL